MKAPGHYNRFFATALMHALVIVAVAFASDQELVRVKRVIDGETVVLENAERGQSLHVKQPRNAKAASESFGKEATEFTKRMVEGKLVRLEFDPYTSRRDKSSRTLAYVFLADGSFVNAEIIRQGYGFAV